MSNAPDWFLSAINQHATEIRVGAKGRQLTVRHWPTTANANGTPLILAHGFLAHARWFDFIAPLLTNLGPVYAFDMPGMGDSDHFDSYHISDYIDCFQDLIDELQLAKPILVSHSLGSLMAMNFAYANPQTVAGLIITDSPFRLISQPADTPRGMKWKYFDTKEDLLARFRLLPDQICQQPYTLAYIAEHSIIETYQGWRWKFDCNRETGTADIYELWETSFERFQQLEIPNAFIYGEDSKLCTPDWIDAAQKRLPPSYPFIGIEKAGHHLLLDQPLAYIDAIQQIIKGW